MGEVGHAAAHQGQPLLWQASRLRVSERLRGQNNVNVNNGIAGNFEMAATIRGQKRRAGGGWVGLPSRLPGRTRNPKPPASAPKNQLGNFLPAAAT